MGCSRKPIDRILVQGPVLNIQAAVSIASPRSCPANKLLLKEDLEKQAHRLTDGLQSVLLRSEISLRCARVRTGSHSNDLYSCTQEADHDSKARAGDFGVVCLCRRRQAAS